MKKLSRSFYDRKTDWVARDLIGKVLVHKTREGSVSGIIVETEAYFGNDDPASHAARRKTPRNEVMFGPPGHAYVYFCYGAHYLFNVVTEKKGVAGAVLIRALEPLVGVELMLKRRHQHSPKLLSNGPGRLTQALKINRAHNKMDLLKGKISIFDATINAPRIKRSGRIGIRNGAEMLHRYYWAANPYVSGKPNK